MAKTFTHQPNDRAASGPPSPVGRFGGWNSPQEFAENTLDGLSRDMNDRQRQASRYILSILNAPSHIIAELGLIHAASGDVNRAALSRFIKSSFNVRCGDDLLTRTLNAMKNHENESSRIDHLYRASGKIIGQLKRDRMAWELDGPSDELQRQVAVHALNLGRNTVALVKTRGFNALPTPETDFGELDGELIELARQSVVSGLDQKQIEPVQGILHLVSQWRDEPDQSIWTIGVEALKLAVALSGVGSAIGIIARLNLAFLISDFSETELDSLIEFYRSMEELEAEIKPEHQSELDRIAVELPGEITFDINGLRLALLTNAVSRRVEATHRFELMKGTTGAKAYVDLKDEFGSEYIVRMNETLDPDLQLAAIDELLESARPLRNAKPFLYDANAFYAEALRYSAGRIDRPTGDDAARARRVTGEILEHERNDLLVRIAFEYAPKVTANTEA